MDKIWDIIFFEVGGRSLAVVAGMEKNNEHAELTKSLMLKTHCSEIMNVSCFMSSFPFYFIFVLPPFSCLFNGSYFLFLRFVYRSLSK